MEALILKQGDGIEILLYTLMLASNFINANVHEILVVVCIIKNSGQVKGKPSHIFSKPNPMFRAEL